MSSKTVIAGIVRAYSGKRTMPLEIEETDPFIPMKANEVSNNSIIGFLSKSDNTRF